MGSRLSAGAALVAVAAACGSATPSGHARKPPAVKPTQELVRLLTSHTAFSALHARPSRTSRVHAWRPITGGPTVLPVLDRATRQGAPWLQVRLPGRPNGTKRWITQRGTVRSKTTWHLVVRTSTRRLRVYRHGRFVRSFAAIVGKPSTPTPQGTFFVEESVRMLPGSAGAPYALALSARSNVLQEFAGGPGQIAIHGVANIGGTLGTAVSHGCVRLANESTRWLSTRISPGVPVTVRR